MNGSEKQIKWATEIRTELLPAYEKMIARLQAGEYAQALGGSGAALRQQPDRVPALIEGLITLLETANASFWIEHRNGPGAVVTQMMAYQRMGKPVVYGKWVS